MCLFANAKANHKQARRRPKEILSGIILHDCVEMPRSVAFGGLRK